MKGKQMRNGKPGKLSRVEQVGLNLSVPEFDVLIPQLENN